jgi:hypothetical protein
MIGARAAKQIGRSGYFNMPRMLTPQGSQGKKEIPFLGIGCK